MGFVEEFKEFAVKGNVVDMAVGIIIGAAFGKIVTSLVNDVVMPVVGQLTGGINFADKFYVLGPGHFETLKAAQDAKASIIAYGSFIQTIVDFLLVSLCIFVMVKQMNKLNKKETAKEEAPPPPPEDTVLLREIRDALKRRPASAGKAGKASK